MRNARAVAPSLLVTAASVYALRPILFHAGTPAYLHDWAWPFTTEQLRDAVHYNASIWNPAGMGSPNAFLMNHPIFWIWDYATALMASAVVLKLTLLLSLIALGTGVAACATRFFGASTLVASTVGIVAMLGPGVYSNLLAGHLYEIMSLGPLFWSLAIVRGGDNVHAEAKALAAGVVAALAALQVQILLLSLVALLGAIALMPARRRAASLIVTALIASTVALVLSLPEIWALFAENSAAYLAPARTLQHWELNNSSALAAAPLAMGYFAAYAERAFASLPYGEVARLLLWSIPALAVVAIVTRWRSAWTWLFASFWVICTALVAGLNGPLAPPLTTAFERFSAASVFRELFHFASPGWAMGCVLAAAGLERLRPVARIASLAPPVAAVLVLWLPPSFASQLQNWQAPRGFAEATHAIAQAAGPWRVLYLPAEMPVAPLGHTTGGFDPSSYGIASHAPANLYHPIGPLEVAIGLQERADPRSERWLQSLGIGAELAQAGIVSRLQQINERPKRWPEFMRNGPLFPRETAAAQTTLAISGSPMAFSASALQIVRDPMEWSNGPGFALARDGLDAVPSDPDRMREGDIAPPVSLYQGTDPSRGWARSSLWAWLDPRIAAIGDGLITWSKEPLAIPAATHPVTAVRALVIHGKLFADGSPLGLPEGKAAWTVVPPEAKSLTSVSGLAVVTGFAGLNVFAPLPLPQAPTSFRAWPLGFDSTALRAEGEVPARARWVVLKQGFSPAWHLRLDRGTVLSHVTVDGYANGWKVRLDAPAHAVIEYAPAVAGAWVVRTSLALWLCAAVAAVMLGCFGRKGPARDRIQGKWPRNL